MASKSGIDMLQEILEKLSMLEKRMDVIDLNIKTITNGTNLAGLINKAIDSPLETHAKAISPQIQVAEVPEKGFKSFKFETVDAAKMKNRVKQRTQKSSGIMVKGKLKVGRDGENIPLAGVSVKIYDEKDTLIKQTKTNRAGHWMSQLPPGNYVALLSGKYNGNNLQQQNINFEVPKSLPQGQTEIEVI